MAEWLTLTQAAERLGWRVRKVESRARREGWQRRRANRGPAMEYLVPEPVLADPQAEATDLATETAESPTDPATPQAAEREDPGAAELTKLQQAFLLAVERAARVEGELAAAGALVAELRGRAERAEGDTAHLRAELAEARRPWLARVIEGFRRR